MHARAAIEAGRQCVFAEKPIAVDAPGVRSFLQTAELARQKRLSLVAGLQLRYSYPHQEAVRRIRDGQIGDVVALQANDFRGPIWGASAPAWLVGYVLADAKLVLLRLAVGRFQRRAARAHARFGQLGQRRISGSGHWQRRTYRSHRAGIRQHLRPFRHHLRIRRRFAVVLPSVGSWPGAPTMWPSMSPAPADAVNCVRIGSACTSVMKPGVTAARRTSPFRPSTTNSLPASAKANRSTTAD
jgi:hypothetical protein